MSKGIITGRGDFLAETSAKSRFLGGVTVLTVSTAAVKLIGLFYKIPLIKLVGIGGMAYFLAAYHIYTLLFMLSTSGLPVAVSILVARSRAEGKNADAERTYRISLILFSLIGVLCSAVLYALSDIAAAAVGIPEASHCIRAVAPSLLFAASGSAVRGYFQGRQDMRPTAISQLIESGGKLILGLAFTKAAISASLPTGVVAAFSIAGLTAGSLGSTLYLFIRRAFVRRKERSLPQAPVTDMPVGKVICEIASISAPITLGAAVMSITSLIDTALIAKRLQAAGFAPSAANMLYSSYGNLSIPMFNLIPAFIAPVALSMTPLLTEAAQRRDRERERELLGGAMRICAIVAIPASLGLAVFGREILTLIFRTEAAATDIAAPLLTVLSPAIFFSCLITVTNAALQAYGKAQKPIISMAFGAAVKIGAEFILVGMPSVNIFGAPISTILCDLTIVLINLYFIGKYTCSIGENGLFGVFARPLFASGISAVATVVFAGILRRSLGVSKYAIIPVIIFNVAFYAFFVLFTGAVSDEDIKLLPQGEKIAGIIKPKRKKQWETKIRSKR